METLNMTVTYLKYLHFKYTYIYTYLEIINTWTSHHFEIHKFIKIVLRGKNDSPKPFYFELKPI